MILLMKKEKKHGSSRSSRRNINLIKSYRTGSNSRKKIRPNHSKEAPSNSDSGREASAEVGRPKARRKRWSFETSLNLRVEDANSVDAWLIFVAKEVLPEKRMWWSVLSQGIFDYLEGGEREREARPWIFSKVDRVGSFVWICIHLDIDPNKIIKKIIAHKKPDNFNKYATKTWGAFYNNKHN
jgi:hypothetical protein